MRHRFATTQDNLAPLGDLIEELDDPQRCQRNSRLFTLCQDRPVMTASNANSNWDTALFPPRFKNVAALKYRLPKLSFGFRILERVAPYRSRPSNGVPLLLWRGKPIHVDPRNGSTRRLPCIRASSDTCTLQPMKSASKATTIGPPFRARFREEELVLSVLTNIITGSCRASKVRRLVLIVSKALRVSAEVAHFRHSR